MIKNLLRIYAMSILLISCNKDEDLAPFTGFVETEPPKLTRITQRVNEVFGGYYEALPARYSVSNKSYPLLVYLHGQGQIGNGNTQLDLLGLDGIGKLLVEQRFPPNFVVNSQNYSFIILAPQYSQQPSPEQILFFIEYAKKTYRVDASRIYLSGLSTGGIRCTETAGKYAAMLAAITPMAGVSSFGGITELCKNIAAANLPVWAFHNEHDPTIPSVDSKNFIAEINSFLPPVKARLTIYVNGQGHDAWTQALNPDTKEDGKNIYEWMLQYSR